MPYLGILEDERGTAGWEGPQPQLGLVRDVERKVEVGQRVVRNGHLEQLVQEACRRLITNDEHVSVEQYMTGSTGQAVRGKHHWRVHPCKGESLKCRDGLGSILVHLRTIALVAGERASD